VGAWAAASMGCRMKRAHWPGASGDLAVGGCVGRARTALGGRVGRWPSEDGSRAQEDGGRATKGSGWSRWWWQERAAVATGVGR
jgi:hypothetical protein